MKIRIPDLNGQKQYIENKSSIVLIGANGAGKTRMSVWIDENNPEYPVHRVSAQKSLNMPQIVRPTEISTAEEEFLYGTTDTDKNGYIPMEKRTDDGEMHRRHFCLMTMKN